MVITGLIIVLLLVLALPFIFKPVEENLEAFLFVMGVAASLISGIMNVELILKALKEPWMIASAVLIAGALFFILKEKFANLMNSILKRVSLSVVVFFVILILGLVSSVITCIVASTILVEIIYLLPIHRKQKIVVCVLACFSIGLGATLTPIGEPLATIAISKLGKDFFYLIDLLGIYIIPAVVFFSLMGAVYISASTKKNNQLTSDDVMEIEEDGSDNTWKGIIVRALKVYLFVMALVFLGEGFEPLINQYIIGLSPNVLFWVNMISSILDNATLTAAEVSRQMNSLTVEAILMGLLISGGMLIPGNIPNIISASKLKISSKEWAVLGVPIGLVVMAFFYVILFVI